MLHLTQSRVIKIGLEAEFLLKKKGKIIFPGDYGISTDDMPLLGEIRGEASHTAWGVVGNFMEQLSRLHRTCDKKGLKIVNASHSVIPVDLFREAQKRQGSKDYSKANNIYGVEALNRTNHIFDESGEVATRRLSCGLHIHFSANIVASADVRVSMENGEDFTDKRERYTSFLSKEMIEQTVKELDEEILPTFPVRGNFANGDVPVDREPGSWEMKSHGFEYRSLPYKPTMNVQQLTRLVDSCFEILDRRLATS